MNTKHKALSATVAVRANTMKMLCSFLQNQIHFSTACNSLLAASHAADTAVLVKA
jgi:hypothetical protein